MPDHRIVPLADLDDVGLQSLALLHQSVMRTLLTDLGLPFILRYYRSARTDESVVGYCLVSLSGDVIGRVVGSPDPAALNGRLRTPARWFAGQILRLAITQPSVFWQLLLSVSSSSKQMATEGGLELTYLGTAAHARGGGLARSLLQAFIDASRTAGYKVVELSVEQDNSAAVGLYASFGFVEKGTFREGRFERCCMELVL